MFSHQTSERFEKERPSTVGPGSYEVPSTLDNKGVVVENSERWQEMTGEMLPGPGDYETKVAEKCPESAVPAPTPVVAKRPGPGPDKENRAPTSARKVLQKSNSQRNQIQQDVCEASKQRQQDLKLAGQLDLVRDELRQKAREGRDLQQQLATKDKKLEDLQKRLDERSRRLDRKEEDQKTATQEASKLRASIAGLQEKLSTAEHARKAADQALLAQTRRGEQAERSCQEQIAALQESLRREEGRRRDLEERAARSGAERDLGETELAAERRRVEDLNTRVAQLEAEAAAKLEEQKESLQQSHKLEDDLSAARARSSVQGEALARAEEARQELEARVARAEVTSEARARDVSAERARVTELEDEQRRLEAQYSEQQSRLEEAETQVRNRTRELSDEHERTEDLERQVAELEERERTALEALQNAEAQRLEVQHTAGLEERVRKAEDNAEEAEAQVRRWREWADEQSLRELTAETQRLEELKRVREDVTRQVEAARHEVVQENEALRQQVRNLESGPDGPTALRQKLDRQEEQFEVERQSLRAAEAERADLESRLESMQKEVAKLKAELGDARGAVDEVVRQAKEERQELECRIAHAEADSALAADELERLEAQVKALNVQHETALAAQVEETEVSRVAERDAAQQREKALDESLNKATSACNLSRWRLLVQLYSTRNLCGHTEATWNEVRRTASAWRGMARGHERDATLLQRQGEELERLDTEAEAFREQNSQLLVSMQQAQQELQWSLAETRRLQEREAAYEGDLSRMSERTAELAGHSNQKQKIKHLMDLKAENNTLRSELKRTKQQLVQQEAQLRTTHFFDSVFAHDSAPPCTRHQTPRKPGTLCPMTPGKQPPRTPSKGDKDPLCLFADERPEAARRERAEALRHAKAHRRASERAALEYQHLAAVVEQVLALQPGQSLGGGGTLASSGTITPDPNMSACEKADPGALRQRLREWATEHSSGSLSTLMAGPLNQSDQPLETPRSEAAAPTTARTSPEPEREDFPLSGRGQDTEESSLA